MAEFAWGRVGTRSELAALLRRLADGLESDGEIKLEEDGVRLSVGVPEKVAFELEAEIDAATGESELELELKWSSRARTQGAKGASGGS
jgi:amphi-Trp domain-containing protein